LKCEELYTIAWLKNKNVNKVAMLFDKKILLIGNYNYAIGGISSQIELLSDHLNNEGYSSNIFSLKATFLRRIFLFFKLIYIGKHYNIFHIHGCSNRGFLPIIYGVIVGKMLHKKLIITYHGGGAYFFFKKHPKFIRYFLLKADKVTVMSGYLKKIFAEFDIPCIVIPNILKMENIKVRKRVVINPNFISIRNLTPIYNVMCVVKAFEIVKSNISSATLTILGTGECLENIEAYIKKNSIKDVLIVGLVPNTEIYKWLDKSDISLFSPLIDNMPISILESFNAGLLVISSNVGGIPYMVIDGKTGYLFESDNEKKLAEKMLLAIENQEVSKKIIINASQELKKYYWENLKDMVIKLYS
jgi:glycosyltransferase involved in cell wall biosynthesis